MRLSSSKALASCACSCGARCCRMAPSNQSSRAARAASIDSLQAGVTQRMVCRPSLGSGPPVTSPAASRAETLALIDCGRIRSARASVLTVAGPSRSKRLSTKSCDHVRSPRLACSRSRRFSLPITERSSLAKDDVPSSSRSWDCKVYLRFAAFLGSPYRRVIDVLANNHTAGTDCKAAYHVDQPGAAPPHFLEGNARLETGPAPARRGGGHEKPGLRLTCLWNTWYTYSTVKQNVTISLDRETVRKAKILAARRETSISGLIAAQIEALVGEDEAYELAKREAMILLDHGFPLGGQQRVDRAELHDR